MSYRKGENLSCCPVCGKQYYAGDFRLRWDGLFVCRYDYEERHPQDFVRGKADNMQPAVVAGCCGAEGPESAPLCPFPLEPLNNAVIGNTTSVNLSFSTFPGVTSYQIYFWEDGESAPATPTYTATNSPYFVTGLEGDTGYNWFVTAVNESGEFRDCSGSARFFTTSPSLPVTVQFSSSTYSANSAHDTVTVTVTRTQNSSAAVSVAYATSDGDAVAGTHYVAKSGTLEWEAGDFSDKTFEVEILEGAEYQEVLNFTVELSSPVGASVGSPSEATISIPPEFVLDSTQYVNIPATEFGLSPITTPSGTVVSINASAADRLIIRKPSTSEDGNLLWNAWFNASRFLNNFRVSDQDNILLLFLSTGLFDSEQAALEEAQNQLPQVLTGSTQYRFWGRDTIINDNSRGISLLVEKWLYNY